MRENGAIRLRNTRAHALDDAGWVGVEVDGADVARAHEPRVGLRLRSELIQAGGTSGVRFVFDR